MTPIKVLIMDFDGVIVESNQPKTEAFELFADLYPEYRDEIMAYHFAHYARSRMFKFKYFIDELMGRPGDSALLDKMAAQFAELVAERVALSPEVAGARAFLEEFSQRIPIYLSSATPVDELKAVLRRRDLFPFFTDIFGDPPTPKSEAIRQALAKEGATPADAVFIGDTGSDRRYAAEAGVRFIGRDSGAGFDVADVEVYPDLTAIAAVLAGQLEGAKL